MHITVLAALNLFSRKSQRNFLHFIDEEGCIGDSYFDHFYLYYLTKWQCIFPNSYRFPLYLLHSSITFNSMAIRKIKLHDINSLRSTFPSVGHANQVNIFFFYVLFSMFFFLFSFFIFFCFYYFLFSIFLIFFFFYVLLIIFCFYILLFILFLLYIIFVFCFSHSVFKVVIHERNALRIEW